eukprot:13892-Heterococcus_DN1.PRE.1
MRKINVHSSLRAMNNSSRGINTGLRNITAMSQLSITTVYPLERLLTAMCIGLTSVMRLAMLQLGLACLYSLLEVPHRPAAFTDCNSTNSQSGGNCN